MVNKPIRIQMSRKKGWKKPPNTVYVGRPSKWGNPYKIGALGESKEARNSGYLGLLTREAVLNAYKKWVSMKIHEEDSHFLDELKGKNLACWCPLNIGCHADILLELANQDRLGGTGE